MTTPAILAVRPVKPGYPTVAFVDVQLDGLRLFNLRLVRRNSGLRIYAPNAYGSSVATFTQKAAAELVRLALDALGDIAPNDRSNAA